MSHLTDAVFDAREREMRLASTAKRVLFLGNSLTY